MILIKRTSIAYWKNFWMDKTDPMSRTGDEAHYDFMASELMVLLGQRPFEFVVEIGCGTGVYYKRLGFDKTSYTGVDFSRSMLGTFKQQYPDAPVFLCENGASYEPAKPVDLIFSHEVIQLFALRDIDTHLGIAARALTPRGRILHAGIPVGRDALALLSWCLWKGKAAGAPSIRGLLSVGEAWITDIAWQLAFRRNLAQGRGQTWALGTFLWIALCTLPFSSRIIEGPLWLVKALRPEACSRNLTDLIASRRETGTPSS